MKTRAMFGYLIAAVLFSYALPAWAQGEPAAAPAAAEATPAAAPAAAPAAEPAAAPAPAEAVPAAAPEAAPAEPAAAAPPAEPPPAEAAPAVPPEIEEIIVTGSRLHRAELATPAPVTVLTKQQIVQSGKSSVAELLQALPAQSNALNIQYNNGGNGASNISLRSLGSQRTLVLLNGRRYPPGGTGADNSVDLNSIPMAAIERIEILKDGASAIYGSDAIGGVVNIITRKNWSGTEVNINGGISPRGDGKMFEATVTTGQKSDKGYFLMTAGYFNQQPVWSGDRAWADKDYAFDYDTREWATMGSSGVPGGYVRDRGEGEGNQTWKDLQAAYPGEKVFTMDLDSKKWRAFKATGIYGGPEGGDFYNYAPANYLVTPQERLNFFAIGNLKVGDLAKLYYEASFTNRKSDQKLAAEPFMSMTAGVTVSKDNGYNPFGRDFIDVRRRLVEFGNRRDVQDLDTYRIVTGMNGRLPEGLSFLSNWFWDVNVNFGRSNGTELHTGSLWSSHIQAAVGPTFADSTGKLHCGESAETEVYGCVPLNLFGGPGTITEDMAKWVSYSGSRKGYSQLAMLSASTSGELFSLFAGRPASLALGYELRGESGADYPDPLVQAGDSTTNQSSSAEGSYSVHEGYGELLLPVLGGMTGVYDLELSAAARGFSYSTFGGGLTYKFGGRYKPIKDVTLRGTYATAFRAPGVGDLYTGNLDSYEDVTDPCSTAEGERDPIADTNCKKDNVPDDLEDDRSQQRTIFGGNPELEPEQAKTLTFGAVFEPRWVKGLSLTVDYYHIKITNAIGSVGPDVILNSCYLKPEGEREYCERVHRDAQGFITTIDNPTSNIGGYETAGVDLGARYDVATPIGLVGGNIEYSWLHKWDQTLATGHVIHGRGNYDLGLVLPVYRLIGGVRWGWKGITAGLNGRYSANYIECVNNSCEQLEGQDKPAWRDVGGYFLMDFFASYDLKTAAGKTSIMLGINNLLDKDPPYVDNGFIVRTDNSEYDFMGRYLYLRLGHAF